MSDPILGIGATGGTQAWTGRQIAGLLLEQANPVCALTHKLDAGNPHALGHLTHLWQYLGKVRNGFRLPMPSAWLPDEIDRLWKSASDQMPNSSTPLVNEVVWTA